MHKIFDNMLTDELAHFFMGKKKEGDFNDFNTWLNSNIHARKYSILCWQMNGNIFQEEDKGRKKKKEGMAYVKRVPRWRTLTYEVPYQ